MIYLSNKIRTDHPTGWKRLLRYPDMALNPCVGLETMVGLAIGFSYTYDIVRTFGNVVGTFGNVWNILPVLSVWLKKKKS